LEGEKRESLSVGIKKRRGDNKNFNFLETIKAMKFKAKRVPDMEEMLPFLFLFQNTFHRFI
jgi:hypothetical protein